MQKGGEADSQDIKADGQRAGHNVDALKRARRKRGIGAYNYDFPRRTKWALQEAVAASCSEAGAGETTPTALTALTAPTAPAVGAVGAVGAVSASLPGDTSTDVTDSDGHQPQLHLGMAEEAAA